MKAISLDLTMTRLLMAPVQPVIGLRRGSFQMRRRVKNSVDGGGQPRRSRRDDDDATFERCQRRTDILYGVLAAALLGVIVVGAWMI